MKMAKLPGFLKRLIQAVLKLLLSESEDWKKDRDTLKK